MAYSTLKHSFNEPKGQSSAVASLLFSRGGERHDVTKSGSYVYTGEAGTYHEWEFRTRLKVIAAGDDPDKYAEAMAKVVEGLRGEAFVVAKEIGSAKICDVGNADMEIEAGVDVLINALKHAVFPQTTHEAKELFRQYCKPSGCLSRQNGESMHQYISRRRRCWKLLMELDSELNLSEGHRADLLLDLAGLDKNERVMIQASIGNVRDFEKIAEALILQHPRPNKPIGDKKGKGPGFKGGKGGKGKYKGRRFGKGR